MPDEWQVHCPISEGEDPIHRKAWKEGWDYRMEHGPGKPDEETIPTVIGGLSVQSIWIQGYCAADWHERSP